MKHAISAKPTDSTEQTINEVTWWNIGGTLMVHLDAKKGLRIILNPLKYGREERI